MAPAIVLLAPIAAVRLKSVARTPRRRCGLPRAVSRARDAEIHHRRRIVNADHDVGGLQVAMNDVGFVRRYQTGDNATRDAQRARDRQPLCSLRMVARSEPSTYGIVMYLMPLMSPRSWIRTTLGCVTCLASSSSRLKRRSISADGDRIRGDLGANDLDRDRHAKFGVPRLVNRAHPADPQHADDVIPGTEGHADLDRSLGCLGGLGFSLGACTAGAQTLDRTLEAAVSLVAAAGS